MPHLEVWTALCEVDAFLKMPRPDEATSGLGTTRLDEPTLWGFSVSSASKDSHHFLQLATRYSTACF